MGASDPRMYWYPEESGSLETLDWAMVFSDLQEIDIWRRVDAYGGDGVFHSYFDGGGQRIRIIRERFRSNSIERAMRGLSCHLGRGGVLAFSLNHSKSWAGYFTHNPRRGDTALNTAGNAFRSWSPSATVAGGDEVVTETPNPDKKREYRGVTSLSAADNFTLSEALDFNYEDMGMVRWRDFYPALRLPEDRLDKPFLTHDRRMNWTLDLILELDERILTAGYDEDGIAVGDFNLADTSSVLGHLKIDLDGVLGGRPSRGAGIDGNAPVAKASSISLRGGL